MKNNDTNGFPETKARIFGFLESNPVGVLATVEPGGRPHAAVIYFFVDKDFNILFTTKSDTKKHTNLQNDKNAILVIFESSSQTTVQITGTAECITDSRVAEQALKHTLRAAEQTSESGVPPIAKFYDGDYVAYIFKPSKIRMAVFARPIDDDSDMYETVDF